jgi:hypothetical protein
MLVCDTSTTLRAQADYSNLLLAKIISQQEVHHHHSFDHGHTRAPPNHGHAHHPITGTRMSTMALKWHQAI